MRPIDKGPCPQVAGANKVVSQYASWRKDLIDRIGSYCVYCNMPLSEQLQVEHVIAKVPVAGGVAGSMLDWSNMLLACGPCNRAKWNLPSNNLLHYLPEEHNSHLPFMMVQHPVHADAAIVIERNGLNAIQMSKATNTISFFHLADVDIRDQIVDLRWMKRKTAIEAADTMYSLLQDSKTVANYNAKDVAKKIAIIALGFGFFSIWYDKFHNEAEVMEALTDNSVIKGSASTCFDAANGYKPIPKNPTDLSDPF